VQIGIVSEGKTDQVVMEHIIDGVLADLGDTFIDMVQPPIAGGGPEDFGNWEHVFKWLASERCRKALQFYDMLIVQIDTDVCERAGFDVSRREQARELEPRELIERVAKRLEVQIGGELMAAYVHKLVFAIAVDQLECWLLPLIFPDGQAKAAKATGCFEVAMAELRRQNQPGLLSAKNATKDRARYAAISRPLRKPQQLALARERQISLDAFAISLVAKASAPEVTR